MAVKVIRRGFFNPKPSNPVSSLVPKCGICKLCDGCNSPKMEVVGNGGLGILIVGQAPGAVEDEEGEQLIGNAGRRLQSDLSDLGVDLEEDCWHTNAVICRPPEGRPPSPREIQSCRPNLIKFINKHKPKMIIPMGIVALKALIGDHYERNIGVVEKWVGWRIPSQRYNAWICPNWHTSYLLDEDNPVLDLWFRRHLQRAMKLEGEPWPDGVPDYTKKVEVIFDSKEAARRIKELSSWGMPTAFDYETDRLKPDHRDSRIFCCSLCCDEDKSFSFLWHGEAIKAMEKYFLFSKVPKIAANLKMEDRWTRKEFGQRVRYWTHDTMQAAHILDNRSGITSLKFQTFVNFGVADYDSHMGRWLKSDGGGNTPNKITEADVGQILLYNGLDSLFTLKLELLQKDRL